MATDGMNLNKQTQLPMEFEQSKLAWKKLTREQELLRWYRLHHIWLSLYYAKHPVPMTPSRLAAEVFICTKTKTKFTVRLK